MISTINSLTLSPALAALLLRPATGKKTGSRGILDFTMGWFFRLFNFGVPQVDRCVPGHRRQAAALSDFGPGHVRGLLYLTYWGFTKLPSGFIPVQDKGYVVASVQMPDATSAGRTSDAMAAIEQIVKETPGVKNVNSVAGNSFMLSAYGSSFGSMFIILDGLR